MRKTLSLVFLLVMVAGLVANPVFSSMSSNGGSPANSRDEVIVHYDGDNDDGIGVDGPITFTVCSRFTIDELGLYNGSTIERVQFYLRDSVSAVTLKVYEGTSVANPDNEVYSQDVPGFQTENWNEVTLTDPITIDTSVDYWVGYEVVATGGFPAGCDAGPAVQNKGSKMMMDGEWSNLYEINPALNSNWNIRVVIEAGDVAYPPQNLQADNLDQLVQLTWEAPADDTPTGYNVYRNTEFLASVTTLTHADNLPGYGNYDYYVTALYNDIESAASNTVRVSYSDPSLVDWTDGFEEYADFSIDFDPWVNVDVDGLESYGLNGIDWTNAYQPQAFIVFNPANTTPALTDLSAYEGDKMAVCFDAVPAAGAYNNDWLITPQFNLGDSPSVSFQVRSATAQYGLERFTVSVSNGSTDPADFTVISTGQYLEAPVDWTELAIDLSAYANQTVRVAVNCISQDAFYLMLDNFSVTGLATTDNEDNQVAANATALIGNYPNPFNPTTTISFNLKNSEDVVLDIYNVLGQKVNTLVNQRLSEGKHSIVWDGFDSNNNKVSSGIYFYKLNAGAYQASKKMILMK